MKCDIYQSGNLSNTYLFVPAKADPIKCISETIRMNLGELTFFKTIDFEVGSPLIAADPEKVIDNINKYGFHVQGAEVHLKIN